MIRTGPPELLGSRLRIPEHVVYRDFVSETVVLNLETGRYHGLNPTGGRILDAIERSETVGDAAEALAVHYKRPRNEVEADVLAFCSDLLTRGLVDRDVLVVCGHYPGSGIGRIVTREDRVVWKEAAPGAVESTLG